MKFLGIGQYCDLGSMYHQLMKDGHQVRVYVENADFRDIYAGILNFTADWHHELEWIREARQEGIILFETATMGEVQDALRQQGYQVIGGSAFGDKLEVNREFGQQILHEMGMPIAQTVEFLHYDAAIDFIRQNKKRYVYKSNDADCERTRNYVSMADDGADLIILLEHYKKQQKNQDDIVDFVLMEFIEGVEIGVGAFFNGEHFLQPACLDWEHKHFMAGNLGELTGEMGTVVTYSNANIIFNQSLLKLAPMLKQSCYCGYINLNMIANADGLWPLEFTSRFGYPGYVICATLHLDSWHTLFRRLLKKSALFIATDTGYAIGVVLNVPPFPYSYGYKELSKGLPILFKSALTSDELGRLHFNEVAKLDDCLVTSGMVGNVATVVGKGETVEAAQIQAYALAAKVIVPNIRYRTDIGSNLIKSDLNQLIDWGYLLQPLNQ